MARPGGGAAALVMRTMYLGVAVVSAALGMSLALALPNPSARPTESQAEGGFLYSVSRPVNLLVMGIDRVPDTKPGSPESFQGRSDTLLLARIDTSRDQVNVLSIPRDTQVEIPDYGLTKINHVNWIGGPRLAREILEHNFNGVQVDRYIRINTGAFRELVDLVGGVKVFVPKRMEYEDKTQKLKIDLQPGWQTLNGEQAEQFARFRQDEYGDIGRVQRQQVLMKALRERVASPAIVPRLPKLMEVFKTYVDTNLTNEEMIALASYGLNLKPEQLKMVMLPGRASEPSEFSASYWLMDAAKKDKLITEYFGQTKLFGGWGEASTDQAEAEGEAPTLRIAVQNASGETERGQAMAEHLRSLGYPDVYVVEDWPETQTTTEIVVQQGDQVAARSLRRQLGFGQLSGISTGAIESDLTVRVGSDWQP